MMKKLTIFLLIFILTVYVFHEKLEYGQQVYIFIV